MRPDSSLRTDTQNYSGFEEAISHLSVVLAHRLRGLVASIEGFTDLLNQTLEESDQRELAMRIMEGTARIESVLSDLQLYGEALQPVMLPVRVDEVLRDLLVPLDDAERPRIQVDLVDDAGDSMMLADPFLMRQLLLILLQNALEAERGKANVRLVVRLAKDAVRFEVWNTGFIDVENAPDVVFAPFYTTKAHNLGVGLSIARRIVRLHDADLMLACNDAEGGTCFAFCVSEPEAAG